MLEQVDRLPDLQQDYTQRQTKVVFQRAKALRGGLDPNKKVSPEKLRELLNEMERLGRKGGGNNWSGDVSEGMEALEGGQTDKAMDAMERAAQRMAQRLEGVVHQHLAHIGFVVAVGVFEEQNVGSLGDDHATVLLDRAEGFGSAGSRSLFVGGSAVKVAAERTVAKARELGADETINYTRDDWPKEVKRLTGRRGVDVVVADGPGVDLAVVVRVDHVDVASEATPQLSKAPLLHVSQVRQVRQVRQKQAK